MKERQNINMKLRGLQGGFLFISLFFQLGELLQRAEESEQTEAVVSSKSPPRAGEELLNLLKLDSPIRRKVNG